MSVHIATEHKVVTESYHCNKCSQTFQVHYIDLPVLDYTECDCGNTARKVKI